MRLLVSACLLGVCCRYDGKHCDRERVRALAARHELIPVCPEQMGGLPTPRPPSERAGERVLTCAGDDVTAAFLRGAREAARLYRLLGCQAAVLKARSPSCGHGMIYDGGFSGTLTRGEGVTAQALAELGATLYTEDDRALDTL